MTTHGRSGLERAVLGSVADEVLRSAPCPVLLVRVNEDSGKEPRLLLPEDPRFAGKAVPARNLVIVLLFGLLFPVLYLWRRVWSSYPM